MLRSEQKRKSGLTAMSICFDCCVRSWYATSDRGGRGVEDGVDRGAARHLSRRETRMLRVSTQLERRVATHVSGPTDSERAGLRRWTMLP